MMSHGKEDIVIIIEHVKMEIFTRGITRDGTAFIINKKRGIN